MKTTMRCVVAAALALPFWAAPAGAHVLPWRHGETRMKSVGKCAKGSCARRYDFSRSRPHHHHNDYIAEGWVHVPGKCKELRV